MSEVIQVVRRRMSFFPRTIIWRDRRYEVSVVRVVLTEQARHTFRLVLDDGTHADIEHDAAAGEYRLEVREEEGQCTQ